MADKKISALTASTTPLAGTEVLPIVQGGSTVKVSVANLTAGRAVNALSATTTAGLRNTSAGSDIASTPDGLFLTDAANKNAIVQLSASGGVSTFIFEAGGAGWRRVAGLLTNGNSVVDVGNLVIGTAGKGIDFSANTHAAGMTSELLNDYEEGTWTATISDGTTDATMNAGRRTGTYTKVGRQVTVTGYIATTSMTGVTGNLRMKGLPFTAGNNDVGGGAVGYADQMTLIAGQVMTLQTQNGADYIVLRYWNGGTTSNMTGSQWGAVGEIGFTLTYFV